MCVLTICCSSSNTHMCSAAVAAFFNLNILQTIKMKSKCVLCKGVLVHSRCHLLSAPDQTDIYIFPSQKKVCGLGIILPASKKPAKALNQPSFKHNQNFIPIHKYSVK